MEVPVLNTQGQQVKTIALPVDIFEAKINTGLMHELFVLQMANARLGTHKTKTRAEVAYSTRKIYRQKGTGRARHGSRKAPIFVGGGTVHGPQPRKYTKHMPKKMRRAAIRSALSALARDQQLVFVDSLNLSAPRTKDMLALLERITGGTSALVLMAERNEGVARSVSNLPKAKALLASYLNIRDLLQYDKVVVPLDALDVIKRIWGKGEN